MVQTSDSVNSMHISPGHETISVEQAIEAQPVMQLIILRTTESPATLVFLFLLMCVFFHLGEIGVLKLCKTVWNSAAHGFLSHLSTSTFVKFHHQGLSTPTEVVVAETVDLSPMLKTSSATKCQDVSGCVANLKQCCGCLGMSRPSLFFCQIQTRRSGSCSQFHQHLSCRGSSSCINPYLCFSASNDSMEILTTNDANQMIKYDANQMIKYCHRLSRPVPSKQRMLQVQDLQDVLRFKMSGPWDVSIPGAISALSCIGTSQSE